MKIGVGRYQDMLRRLLHATSEAAPGELEDFLVATLAVENDRFEWRLLRGEHSYELHTVLGAVAGNRNAARLRNPAGSGIIAVIEYAYGMVQSADAQLDVCVDMTMATPGTTVSVGANRDRRETVRPACLLENETDTSANLSPRTNVGIMRARALSAARTYLDWDSPVLLGPGTDWGVVSAADQQTLLWGCIWRERAMDRYEVA